MWPLMHRSADHAALRTGCPPGQMSNGRLPRSRRASSCARRTCGIALDIDLTVVRSRGICRGVDVIMNQPVDVGDRGIGPILRLGIAHSFYKAGQADRRATARPTPFGACRFADVCVHRRVRVKPGGRGDASRDIRAIPRSRVRVGSAGYVAPAVVQGLIRSYLSRRVRPERRGRGVARSFRRSLRFRSCRALRQSTGRVRGVGPHREHRRRRRRGCPQRPRASCRAPRRWHRAGRARRAP